MTEGSGGWVEVGKWEENGDICNSLKNKNKVKNKVLFISQIILDQINFSHKIPQEKLNNQVKDYNFS